MYTKQQLQESFEELLGRSYKGVVGVSVFDTGKPGPTVAISCFTHGNEPSGIAAYRYLMEQQVQSQLVCGKLFFVINNPKAASAFFSAETTELENLKRFIDVNMNRLPEDSSAWSGDERYEVRRAIELLAIWQEFEIALDIHSTKQDSPPMFVMGDNVPKALYVGMPIGVMLTNIHHAQIGLPAYAFYGDSRSPARVFEIEAGQHMKPESFARASLCAEIFLQNAGVIARPLHAEASPEAIPVSVYDIAGSIIAPNLTYTLERVFKDFDAVTGGTVLACGDGAPLVMPFDGHVIFGPAQTKIMFEGEEVFFISKPAYVL